MYKVCRRTDLSTNSCVTQRLNQPTVESTISCINRQLNLSTVESTVSCINHRLSNRRVRNFWLRKKNSHALRPAPPVALYALRQARVRAGRAGSELRAAHGREKASCELLTKA